MGTLSDRIQELNTDLGSWLAKGDNAARLGGFGQGLLSASGWSNTPISMGQAMGMGQQGMLAGQREALQSRMGQMQLSELEADMNSRRAMQGASEAGVLATMSPRQVGGYLASMPGKEMSTMGAQMLATPPQYSKITIGVDGQPGAQKTVFVNPQDQTMVDMGLPPVVPEEKPLDLKNERAAYAWEMFGKPLAKVSAQEMSLINRKLEETGKTIATLQGGGVLTEKEKVKSRESYANSQHLIGVLENLQSNLDKPGSRLATGAVGEAIEQAIGAADTFLPERISKSLRESVNAENMQNIRSGLKEVVAMTVPYILNDDSGRYSNQDMNIARNWSKGLDGLQSKPQAEQHVKELLMISKAGAARELLKTKYGVDFFLTHNVPKEQVIILPKAIEQLRSDVAAGDQESVKEFSEYFGLDPRLFLGDR